MKGSVNNTNVPSKPAYKRSTAISSIPAALWSLKYLITLMTTASVKTPVSIYSSRQMAFRVGVLLGFGLIKAL